MGCPSYRAFKTANTVVDGRVQQSNFHDFRILRIEEMPQLRAEPGAASGCAQAGPGARG